MDDYKPDYHFMRDQYLESLWAAQRVEDRRLSELIVKRLRDTATEMTVASAPPCEIIPFPSINVPHAGCVDGHDDIRLIWPRQPLRHLLSMIGGYCAVVLFFALFGIAA